LLKPYSSSSTRSKDMNYNGRRLYSVHTREEIREKMMKEVVQISEVFSLSLSDATVILVHLCWNLCKASDRLVDDKEKFLSELGLVGSSDEDLEVDGEGDDNLVSTPFCSHKFSRDCWRDYLSKTLKKKKKKEDERVLSISCLSQDCVASVGPGTVEKLGEPVKEMYERYLLASFMESNKETIKRCPDCDDYAIKRHDEVPSEDFDVVCLCGHIFCWSCQLESHRPVTCNNASFWLNELFNDSALIRHMTLWETSDAALQRSKWDLEAVEEKIMDANCSRELDVKALREAWMLTVQCRLLLKWSCVFGYLISDYHIAKKQYLDYLREKANANLLKHKETLHENDSFDQECRMCVFSFESPPHVALCNVNSSASSHQQQQVTNVPNNLESH
ncbi:hypothetical protein HID58_004156, partial [Brassica napus]